MFVCNASHLRTITSVVVAAVVVSSPGEALAGKSPRRAASEPGAAAVAEPAAVPDATFSVLIGRPIELVMRSGPAVAGTLLGFEADTVTIARPDGRVHTLSRGECTQVNLTVPPPPPPPTAPPRADAPPRDHDDEEDDDEPPSGRGMGITSIVFSSVGLVQVLGVALPFLLLDVDETLGWAALGSGITHAFIGLGLGLGATARKRQHQAWKDGRRAHLAPSLRLDRGGVLLGLGGRF